MTTPLTPETKAGQRLAQTLSDVPHLRWSPQRGTFEADIAAIEAEARERVDPDLRAVLVRLTEIDQRTPIGNCMSLINEALAATPDHTVETERSAYHPFRATPRPR